MCDLLVDTRHERVKITFGERLSSKKNSIDCNSKVVLCNGSTVTKTMFHARADDYQNTDLNFRKKQKPNA